MSFSPIPKERGSVRPVTIEGDPKRYYCEVRAASPRTGLQVGAVVYVNFGTPNQVEGTVVSVPGLAESGRGEHGERRARAPAGRRLSASTSSPAGRGRPRRRHRWFAMLDMPVLPISAPRRIQLERPLGGVVRHVRRVPSAYRSPR